MAVVGLILMVAGTIVVIIGSIWFYVVAFQESVLWGLGCLLFYPVAFFFLIIHLDKAGKPFLLQLAGVVPIFAGMNMFGPGV